MHQYLTKTKHSNPLFSLSLIYFFLIRVKLTKYSLIMEQRDKEYNAILVTLMNHTLSVECQQINVVDHSVTLIWIVHDQYLLWT